ncbi:ribosomal L28 family-domain-containing protein [Cubamyces lactineus]|nr:ribosomal L28 family-domain-containing protein [Cubamyces lactineus]
MFPSIPLLAVVSAPFKRSQLGLFQGKMKQYGNNVPNSKHKTRRTWLPNVHNQRLYSDALQQFVRLKVTARALKTIKKYGNIDKYLLNTKPELLGWEGMRLRLLVREKQQVGEVAKVAS